MNYSQISDEFRENFFKLVESATKILITSHADPDDDAIGCVLSTYRALSLKYPQKTFKILFSGPIDQRWNTFPDFEKIEVVDDIAGKIEEYDLTIFLDQSQYQMFSNLSEKLDSNKKPTICIDHHKNTPSKFTLLLQQTDASSATELVYMIFCNINDKVPTHLAETLLLGIMGDSGYLEFIKPSTAYVYSIVQKLVIDGDINIQEFKYKHTTYSPKVFEIIQELTKNMKFQSIAGWPKFTTALISREFIQNKGYRDLEISSAKSIFTYLFSRSFGEYPWNITLVPKLSGDVSVSIRSLPGSVNAKDLMAQMEIGGGHDRAAGGKFIKQGKKDLETQDCLEKIFNWMQNQHPKTTNE